MVRNRDGYEMYVGDQATAVKTTAAETLLCEGTITNFRYQGLQVEIQIADGTKHWCNSLSAEIVPPKPQDVGPQVWPPGS